MSDKQELAYLVLDMDGGRGTVLGVRTDVADAHTHAWNVDGVVVAVPIIGDYRKDGAR
jgi:hypothetical protein